MPSYRSVYPYVASSHPVASAAPAASRMDTGPGPRFSVGVAPDVTSGIIDISMPVVSAVVAGVVVQVYAVAEFDAGMHRPASVIALPRTDELGGGGEYALRECGGGEQDKANCGFHVGCLLVVADWAARGLAVYALCSIELAGNVEN